MKIDLIAFTKIGAKLASLIMEDMKKKGHMVSSHIAKRHSPIDGFSSFSSVYEVVAELFNSTDALIFVGASGIAVRAIAPNIKSKLTDPAVLVCDETGQFVISLLSGHAGGANDLTLEVANILKAQPVITTASDLHVTKDNLSLEKNLVLGIGCRRGVPAEVIERTVTILLWDEKIPLKRISEVASIDVKKDEKGLLTFVKAHNIPISFYSAKKLASLEGDFTKSDLVLKTVGVDNVCERAATLCGKKGKLIVKKTAKDGVTIAVFEKE